jgi:hypothetical protein
MVIRNLADLIANNAHVFVSKMFAEIARKKRVQYLEISLITKLYEQQLPLAEFLAQHGELLHFILNMLQQSAPTLSLNAVQHQFTRLADGLLKNTRLQVLWLNNAHISHECLHDLLRVLKSLSRLRDLALIGNLLCDDDAVAISKVLSESKTIRTLDMTHNLITAAGGEKCMLSWKSNYYITSLDILSLTNTDSIPMFISMNKLSNICSRNKTVRWAVIHGRIVEMYLAFAPLELPVYVLLWIIDWLPPMSLAPEHNHFKKVQLLQNLVASRCAVIARRSCTAQY